MKALLHNYIVGGLFLILIFRKNGAAAKLNAEMPANSSELRDPENKLSNKQNQTHDEIKKIVYKDEFQEGNDSSLLNEQSQISMEPIHKHVKLDRNKTLFNATKFRLFNSTAISYSACEKLDFAVSFVSSLDWEKAFVNISDSEGEMSATIWDIYFLQIILTTVSIGLGMFGTTLLFPACILAACCFGIFSTCYIIENFPIRSVSCQMKLALSTVAGCVAAFFASGLIRFGLFSLGSISFGSGTYFIFDAFPDLDPGDVPVTTTSDLSSIAWIVIVVMGLFGGLIIRYFEQASFEGVTAIMGGIGCAYSVHTFVLIQGGRLDRSFTFLIGSIFSIIGWRFQRRRRLWNAVAFHKNNEDFGENNEFLVPPTFLPQQYQRSSSMVQTSCQNPTTLMHSLLQEKPVYASATNDVPSSEQMNDLTTSINLILEHVKNSNNKTTMKKEFSQDSLDLEKKC